MNFQHWSSPDDPHRDRPGGGRGPRVRRYAARRRARLRAASGPLGAVAAIAIAFGASGPLGAGMDAPTHPVSTGGSLSAGTSVRAAAAGSLAGPDATTNWAGMIAPGSTEHQISAQWVVPRVAPSSAPRYSATWIGLGGFGSSSLIQVGTNQDSLGAGSTYEAWYETFPSSQVELGAVSPGDTIRASIAEVTAGTWSVSIDDLSSGLARSATVRYTGATTPADWVEEAPTSLSGAVEPLADFGTAYFGGLEANWAPVNVGGLTALSMVDAAGVSRARPSYLGPSSFAVTYEAPTAPLSAAPGGSYIIQPGDTLTSIAARLGTTVAALASANGIADPNVISAGQMLVVPGRP